MGCGCGGAKPNVSGSSGVKSYSLTMPDGSKTYYDTETAARAANSKLGGRGLVRKMR